MGKKMYNRRSFLEASTLAGVALPVTAFSGNISSLNQLKKPEINSANGFETGVIVSTHPNRGHYRTKNFKSDVEAVQTAYDAMMTSTDLPKTLILDSAARPFEFDGYLDIWQSKCRITSTGGVTIIPKKGYKGPVIQSNKRPETILGEDKFITDIIMDNIWIDGNEECMGIRLRDLQLSTIHDLHVKSTDGPGLWISNCVIENLFSNIILSDNCGSEEYPALLIEPEHLDIYDKAPESNTGGFSNHPVNSTHFCGIMIHYPTNDCLRISAQHVPSSSRHRKIQFVGCYFHGNRRQTKPLITLSGAYEISFVGTQMLIIIKEGTVIQMGEGEGERLSMGLTTISHCIITGLPGSNTTGIKMVNVDTGAPSLIAFGNAFGTHRKWLAHAVDWGKQEGKLASWGANSVMTTKEPYLGVLPKNADILPWE